jgi:hypothetical protein
MTGSVYVHQEVSMTTAKKIEAKRKRDAVIEEVLRRLALMTDEDIDYEFAAIENGLEVHVRFVPERQVRSRRSAASRVSHS